MKTKRQKKYLTEESILKDIDATHRKLKHTRDRAAALQSEAELCAEKVTRDKLLDSAVRLWKKAERLENTRLPKLGDVLARFRTIPFPVEGLYNPQVVLEAK